MRWSVCYEVLQFSPGHNGGEVWSGVYWTKNADDREKAFAFAREYAAKGRRCRIDKIKRRTIFDSANESDSKTTGG